MSNAKKIRKSSDKKLSGVCAGIAEYFDIDPTFIRIGWVILTLCTTAFPGIIAYIVCALVFPDATSSSENVDHLRSANSTQGDTTHVKGDF